MARRKIILVTPGDPAGIGPEIVCKTFRARKGSAGSLRKHRGFDFVCVGATAPFMKLGARLIEVSEQDLLSGRPFPESGIPILPAPVKATSPALLLEGFQSGWSIEKATDLVKRGIADALVTGPISKERLQRGGFPYSGHTDFLADLCGIQQVTMMLANEILRISLVTVHIGLKDVPAALTRNSLRTSILHTVEHLRLWWGITKPRVAIAALNPHAGESGIFGDEEIRVISPEVVSLQKKLGRTCVLSGPLPADTLFANHLLEKAKDRFDAVVCMYHDQGLIPVKLLDFQRTVNVTLGLPIVRTSVDHGTAFDIVGKNKADPSSLQSAIALAVDIVKKRMTT